MKIIHSPSAGSAAEKEPLRIFHFLYDHIGNPWVGGGAAHRALEIYSRLATRHYVTIISGKYPGAEDYTGEGIKFRFVGTSRDNYVLSTFSYAYRAARFLRENRDRADIVVEDFAPYNPIFSHRVRKDAVLQLHQKEGFHILRKYLIFGLPFYLVERCYAGSFKNVTAVSEQSRLKYGLGPEAPVIPNGFDESYLSVEGGEGDDGGYLLFMGRLEMDSKGLDVLFETLKELEGVHLKIAGKGKDEQKVRELAARAEANRIEMLGFVEGKDKRDVLKDCTALLLPSRFEAQGIVVLEAAAFGKPVIVSDIPELAYAVEGGFGLSFRREDAKDLAGKIKYLMENKDLRGGMGEKARHYAKDFTWNEIADRYEGFLLQALRGNG
jgi:glycosyltransferase involved in cell wall biosynthesis